MYRLANGANKLHDDVVCGSASQRSVSLVHGLSFTQQGHKYTRTNLYPLLEKKIKIYAPKLVNQ